MEVSLDGTALADTDDALALLLPPRRGGTYPEPLDDALRVRDRIAFWNEGTDIRVDGELQPRPVTP